MVSPARKFSFPLHDCDYNNNKINKFCLELSTADFNISEQYNHLISMLIIHSMSLLQTVTRNNKLFTYHTLLLHSLSHQTN